jgi:hypothetical protein
MFAILLAGALQVSVIAPKCHRRANTSNFSRTHPTKNHSKRLGYHMPVAYARPSHLYHDPLTNPQHLILRQSEKFSQ